MTNHVNTALARDTWIIHVAVVLSYFGKATVKAVCGFYFGSPLLINDSIHSIIDIWEHALVAVVGKQARKEAEARFPLGRKPLLDVVGFVIGLSMAGLALKCLKDGFSAALHAMDLMFGIKGLLPSWLTRLLPELTRYGTPSQLWIIGAIFIACALLSFLVYPIEYGLARKHRLKEYQDDATGLWQDAVLELATGLCVLGAWLLVIVVRASAGKAWSFETVTTVTTAVVLLGLCAYLFTHAVHSIAENTRNLLHPGLDDESVDLLRAHLARAIPCGCELVKEKVSDITCYTSGDVLYVTGVIRIPRSRLYASDLVMDHAQHVAASFLKGKAGDVNVRFFPAPEEWSTNDAHAQWGRLLTEIWLVKPEGVVWEYFSSLKRGELSKAAALAESGLESVGLNERMLRLWVLAMATLYGDGGLSPSAEVVAGRVGAALDEMPEQDARRVAFHCWDLVRAITSGRIHGQSEDGREAAALRAIEAAAESRAGVPEILRAEAEFVLGMLAERQGGYDLQLSEHRYRQALALYLSSGFPLEADRLLNTWGHQKSLLFEIEEAAYLLNLSRTMKELKGDKLGLAFTLGCLGDNHRRAGEFENAIACYLEDLRISEAFSIDHSAASVTCKLGETEVCAGFLGQDASLLNRGVERLRNLYSQNGLSDQARFFAGKGLAKGLLWKAAASGREYIARLLSDAEGVLVCLRPFSPYSAAHLDRLNGRLARLRGDYGNAVRLLMQAQDSFVAMTGNVKTKVSSLQAICCGIEAAMARGPQDGRAEELRVACEDLRRLVNSLQGLLGAARERMESLLEVGSPVHRAAGKAFWRSDNMERLIAFLEG